MEALPHFTVQQPSTNSAEMVEDYEVFSNEGGASPSPSGGRSVRAAHGFSRAPTVHEDLEAGDGSRQRLTSVVSAVSDFSKLDAAADGAVHVDIEKQVAKEAAEEAKTWLVTWDGPEDPENPMNWTEGRKWGIVMLTAACTFIVSFSSSVFSAATAVTAKQFGVSLQVMILGVSLYVLGFAFGPLVWGPLSERYGRYYPLMTGMVLFVIFQIPIALAQNVETLLLGRFFAGAFGSSSLAIVAGIYVDFMTMIERGTAMSVFASAVFMGPALGPIVGAYVTESSLGWRWTAWITMIVGAPIVLASIVWVPETSAPILLQKKAERRRHQTKEWAWHSELDESPIPLSTLMTKYFFKPFHMLFLEPILIITVIYISLIYAILYLIFFAYPYSFQYMRGWSAGEASLPFIALLAGVLLACVIMAIDNKVRFAKKLAQTGKLVAEDRLPQMIIGSFVLPIGLFWFAWTSDPSMNAWPQILAGVPIGMGITAVFFNGLTYTIDVYLWNATSALAVNTFVRSACAAGFPLFSKALYSKLGVAWATSLLGFLCVAMLPFPILFWVHGEKLRAKGKYAFVL